MPLFGCRGTIPWVEIVGVSPAFFSTGQKPAVVSGPKILCRIQCDVHFVAQGRCLGSALSALPVAIQTNSYPGGTRIELITLRHPGCER